MWSSKLSKQRLANWTSSPWQQADCMPSLYCGIPICMPRHVSTWCALFRGMPLQEACTATWLLLCTGFRLYSLNITPANDVSVTVISLSGRYSSDQEGRMQHATFLWGGRSELGKAWENTLMWWIITFKRHIYSQSHRDTVESRVMDLLFMEEELQRPKRCIQLNSSPHRASVSWLVTSRQRLVGQIKIKMNINNNWLYN